IVACVALAATRQDAAVGPPAPADLGTASATVTLPPVLASRRAVDEAAPATEPAKPAVSIPVEEFRRPSRPLEENRSEAGPSVGGFVVGSFAVVGFLGAAFLLLKRFGKNSRLLGGAGAIKVLGRRGLGQKQEIILVEVGSRVFMIGATRDHLSTLGEFATPDEVAVLRADLPQRKDDSHRMEFNQSLREGLKGEEV